MCKSTLQERVARAIWNIQREYEDRCDMELEDMGRGHKVWELALAAMKAMRVPTVPMALAADDAVVEQYAANPKWEEAKDMAEGLIPTRIWAAMLDAEISIAEGGKDDL